MYGRLNADLLRLIANKNLNLNPETGFLMQMVSRGFFSQILSEEAHALHELIVDYTDIIEKYHCPAERKNWKAVRDLIRAQECNAANGDVKRLHLLRDTRRRNVTKLKAAKLTLEHIFHIKDHNGNHLVALAKIGTKKSGKCNPVLDYFYSIACSELESKGSMEDQALLFLKNEKYNPALYLQPIATVKKVLLSLLKFLPEEEKKKKLVVQTLSIAIQTGRISLVKEILRILCFADPSKIPLEKTQEVFFCSESDIKKYIRQAMECNQIEILKIILQKAREERYCRPGEGGYDNNLVTSAFSKFLFNQLDAYNININEIQQYLSNSYFFPAYYFPPGETNGNGSTFLHRAAYQNYTWFVYCFLSRNANPFASNNQNKKPSELTTCIKTKALLLQAEFLFNKANEEKISILEERKLREWALSAKQDIEIKHLLKKYPALKNIPGLEALAQLAEETQQSFLFKNMPICLDIMQSFIDTAAIYLSNYKFETPKYNPFGRYEAFLYVDYQTEDRSSFFYYPLKDYSNFITFISDVICDFGLAYLKEKYLIHKMIAYPPNGGGQSYTENDFMGHKGILHDFLIMDMQEGSIYMDWDKYREVLAKINPQFQKANEALLPLDDKFKGREKLPFSFNGYGHKLVEDNHFMNKLGVR